MSLGDLLDLVWDKIAIPDSYCVECWFEIADSLDPDTKDLLYKLNDGHNMPFISIKPLCMYLGTRARYRLPPESESAGIWVCDANGNTEKLD